MMIARKYRPKLTKVDDKENDKVAMEGSDYLNIFFGIFIKLEK